MCKAGESREKSGRCITNLVLAPDATAEASAKVVPGQAARSKLLYTAVRALQQQEQQSKEQQSGCKSSHALNEKGFAEGDMAVLSIEGAQHLGIRTTKIAIFFVGLTRQFGDCAHRQPLLAPTWSPGHAMYKQKGKPHIGISLVVSCVTTYIELHVPQCP